MMDDEEALLLTLAPMSDPLACRPVAEVKRMHSNRYSFWQRCKRYQHHCSQNLLGPGLRGHLSKGQKRASMTQVKLSIAH